MANYKKIIEINGVKLEVDLSQARVVSNYRIGDSVKVLRKEYNNKFISHPGVIVGFDNFKNLPTIVVAYLKVSYSDANIEFVYLNNDTEDVEICPATDTELPYDRSRVIGLFDRQIEEEKVKLEDLISKKSYFVESFGHYFDANLEA